MAYSQYANDLYTTYEVYWLSNNSKETTHGHEKREYWSYYLYRIGKVILRNVITHVFTVINVPLPHYKPIIVLQGNFVWIR